MLAVAALLSYVSWTLLLTCLNVSVVCYMVVDTIAGVMLAGWKESHALRSL